MGPWLHSHWQLPQGRLETWSSSRDAEQVSQDAWLVLPLGDRLRLAVADGVTPTDRTPCAWGQDGGTQAADLVLSCLRSQAELQAAALQANALLCRPEGVARDNPQATLVACDLFPDGRVQLLQAGDCQAWLPGADGWQQLFPQPMWTEAAQQAWQGWVEQHRELPRTDAGRDLRQRAQAQLMADPEAWNTTPLGLFPQPKLQHRELPGVQQLVLASDGAELQAPALEQLDEWLGELREREAEGSVGAAGKRHDDVTVLRWSRS